MKRVALILVASLCCACISHAAELSGELKQWHKVTLTFGGPATNELAEPNPFLYYRLDVTFTHERGGAYVVPGYYAADGDAANTSADSGSKWRVHFAPDATGEWSWRASFREGENTAVDANALAGRPAAPIDGASGKFSIAPSDKGGRDLRGKGRLDYVGEHYLRFAGTGEWFLKAGADAPENLLAYADFDATPNKGGRRKQWAPHAGDYSNDADGLLWGPNRDKGKNLLGAVNYLASEGLNVFSFLTFNVDGDDGNVFPHLLNTDQAAYEAAKGKGKEGEAWDKYVQHTRFDVSKLAQWERIFEYGDQKGMYLHFKTQETETDHKMDGGGVGIERKVYFRELIARFGHHLALNWNMGEENTQSTEQLVEEAQYIHDVDPYDHNIVLHTFPNKHEAVYGPLLGANSQLTGLSIQTSNPSFTEVHGAVVKWVTESAKAGKKWVVAVDEPGDATHALITDAEDPTHDNARINGLWGAFIGGGAGTEWYFGYKHPHSDLTCEDFRSRDLFWDQCRVALEFFRTYQIPFWKMAPNDAMSGTGDWVLEGRDEQGRQWVVALLPKGGETKLALPEGNYAGGWFNPRTISGMSYTKEARASGGQQTLHAPDGQDWVLLLAEGDAPQPRATAAPMRLSAVEDFPNISVAGFAPAYIDKARKALALNAAQYPGKTAATETTYQGPDGVMDIQLATMTETDGESTYGIEVNGKAVGSFTNPPAGEDYERVHYVWTNVPLQQGDILRVTFNAASNGKIPEGGGFAFSRGRWTALTIAAPGTVFSGFPARTEGESLVATANKPTEQPESETYTFDFAPEKAGKVFLESDGVLATEAEDFAKQSVTSVRKWYVTSLDNAPGIEPDGDESHADTASGKAYLEVLPDTRRTHADKLIQKVNFTNDPGVMAILHYPVYITKPGRYYVWVRACCTGSEDNGIHVGLDGEWPESGQRMQWTGSPGAWQWDTKQRTNEVHIGVRHQIWLDVNEPGYHTVTFSMREDGFEFDKWFMTLEPKLEVPTDAGPAAKLK